MTVEPLDGNMAGPPTLHGVPLYDEAGEERTFTAREYILHEVLQEMEAAVASNRSCTYSLRVPELEALGQLGVEQPVYACRTCADARGAPVGVWCVR